VSPASAPAALVALAPGSLPRSTPVAAAPAPPRQYLGVAGPTGRGTLKRSKSQSFYRERLLAREMLG
jgi:hypothetical protein